MITHRKPNDKKDNASLINVNEGVKTNMPSTADPLLDPLTDKNLETTLKVQWFLVRFSALLAILGFAAFLVTRDLGLLLCTSLLAYPLFAVINYYFPKQKIMK